MARFNASEVENYKPAGTGSFFGLANDKDCESVRLMYNNMDDAELFSVHEIEVNGKSYWVNCLREYDKPVDDCPLCAAGNRLQVKMWVPLYIEKTGEVKIWERGRTFVPKLEGAARRFNPLVSNIFEIERNGKKGDRDTTYEIFHIKQDDKKLEDLPAVPDVVGSIVKELTFDEMANYLQSGTVSFGQEDKPQTRNPVADRRPVSNNDQVARRQVRTRTSVDTQPRTDVF